MTICIISPHPDDAILSCGIRMQREIALGHEILILTIFSDSETAIERKHEDRHALEKMGAKAFYLDEKDAPMRDKRYKNIKEMVFGDFTSNDMACVTRIARKIEDFCYEHSVTEILFPLAAGMHIDHRISFEASRQISHPVRFYEERPYTLWPGVLQSRLRSIGIPYAQEITEEAMTEAIDTLYFLKYFVPEGSVRQECLPLYIKQLEICPKEILAAEAETLVALPEELEKLYGCLREYTSQMELIFPTYATFLKDSLKPNGYEERTWRFLRAQKDNNSPEKP